MKTFILAALTLISCHAFADIASEADVLKVCSSMSGSLDQNYCFGQVQGRQFDSGALAVCGAFSGDLGILNCLTAIQGAGFDPNALRVCSSESGNLDQQNCLQNIAGKQFVPVEIAFCGKESGDLAISNCLVGLSSTPLKLAPTPVVPPVVTAPKCVDQNSVAVIRAKLLQALKDIDSDHFDQADADIRSALSNL